MGIWPTRVERLMTAETHLRRDRWPWRARSARGGDRLVCRMMPSGTRSAVETPILGEPRDWPRTSD